MKQLTGMDASFLYMETPNVYGHVNGLGVYDRPSEDFNPYREVRRRFETLVGHLEPLRRKVVEVPFNLDHPYWVFDEDFDLDYHVREIGLAPPGAADQLAEQVARIVGRPMDRSRPLWEIYVIEGLGDGRWAMLTKTHHATIDGAAGVIMMKMFTDSAPDSEWEYEAVEWESEPVPSQSELVGLALQNLLTNPVKAARMQLAFVRNLAERAGVTSVTGFVNAGRDLIAATVGRTEDSQAARDQLKSIAMPVTPAPPTPWNKPIGPHRRFAMRTVSLDNVKRLKDATGGTVNDVVMAIVSGALRQYLLDHDALPDAPLRAMVPVSIRTGDEDDPWTNRVSMIVAELPTNEPDPIRRVALCQEAMATAKKQLDLIPAETLTDATATLSPLVATAALRLVSRLSSRAQLPVNVVVSNVPGPREPLYFAGAHLDAYIPVSTISDNVGLNITVHSLADHLDFGLVSDRELVPDLWHLVDLHVDEMARLFEATGAKWAVPQTPPAPRVEDMTAAEVAAAKEAVRNNRSIWTVFENTKTEATVDVAGASHPPTNGTNGTSSPSPKATAVPNDKPKPKAKASTKARPKAKA